MHQLVYFSLIVPILLKNLSHKRLECGVHSADRISYNLVCIMPMSFIYILSGPSYSALSAMTLNIYTHLYRYSRLGRLQVRFQPVQSFHVSEKMSVSPSDHPIVTRCHDPFLDRKKLCTLSTCKSWSCTASSSGFGASARVTPNCEGFLVFVYVGPTVGRFECWKVSYRYFSIFLGLNIFFCVSDRYFWCFSSH